MSAAESACPFHAGDRVVYSPSDRTRGLLVMTEYANLKPGEICLIAKIDQQAYVVLEGFEDAACGGIFWTQFSKVAV